MRRVPRVIWGVERGNYHIRYSPFFSKRLVGNIVDGVMLHQNVGLSCRRRSILRKTNHKCNGGTKRNGITFEDPRGRCDGRNDEYLDLPSFAETKSTSDELRFHTRSRVPTRLWAFHSSVPKTRVVPECPTDPSDGVL